MIKEKTTFKPLKGGSFRCNQTGEIVKSARTKLHRRVREMNLTGQNKKKVLLKKQEQEKKAAEQRRQERTRQQDFWRTSSNRQSFGYRSPFSWGW